MSCLLSCSTLTMQRRHPVRVGRPTRFRLYELQIANLKPYVRTQKSCSDSNVFKAKAKRGGQ